MLQTAGRGLWRWKPVLLYPSLSGFEYGVLHAQASGFFVHLLHKIFNRAVAQPVGRVRAASFAHRAIMPFKSLSVLTVSPGRTNILLPSEAHADSGILSFLQIGYFPISCF